MSDLISLIHAEIDRRLSRFATKAYGEITSYDPDTHSAKVKIMPDGFESGWLPISTQHIGNGWGIVAGYQIGDQVEMSVVGGDINGGAITGRLHSDVDKPPTAQSGEIVIQHTSGAKIKFSSDGKMAIHSESDVNVTSTGNVNIN